MEKKEDNIITKTEKTIVRKDDSPERKIEILSSRLNWARSNGKSEIVNQLQRMYNQLLTERMEKEYVERFTEMCKNSPRVIESDPSLIPQEEHNKKNDFFGNNFDRSNRKVKKRLF